MESENDIEFTLCGPTSAWRAPVIANGLTFADFDHPPKASLIAVDSGLELHNHSVAPLSDVKPLASFASNPAGQVIAGAVGRTWGRCCELLQLWVDPMYRAQGVATRLLERFERRATDRGCSVFYLTTLSFQAPAFYRKCGYASIAEISGYPNDITKLLMYKELPDFTVQTKSTGARKAASKIER